jgi:sugar phosphate isomerase/epimerase
MDFSVCSYSFHRSFDAGTMDVDGYIEFSRDSGFTQLDAWSRHLERTFDDRREAQRLRAVAEDAGVPFASVAIDGADAWAPTEEERAAHRERSDRWLDTAAALGARFARFNAGPFRVGFEPGEGTAAMFDGVVAGFTDLVRRGRERGVEIVTENHWGPFQHPDDLGRLLDAVPGLGLLFDTANWPAELQQTAWERYAPRARLTHMKTFAFDGDRETTQDLPRVVRLLRDGGYDGPWGIESEPESGDEREVVVRSLAVLRGLLDDRAEAA